MRVGWQDAKMEWLRLAGDSILLARGARREADTFEAAIGEAENLRAKREAMFPIMNRG